MNKLALPMILIVCLLALGTEPVRAASGLEIWCKAQGQVWALELNNVGFCTIAEDANVFVTGTLYTGETIQEHIINYGTIHNNGTLHKSDISYIENRGGSFINNGYAEDHGGIFGSESTIINTGALVTHLITNEGTVENRSSGTITNYGTIYNTGTISNTGTIENESIINNYSAVTHDSTGVINNDGTIINILIINNFGTIRNNVQIYNYGYINNGGIIWNYGTINPYGTIEGAGTICNNCRDILHIPLIITSVSLGSTRHPSNHPAQTNNEVNFH